MRRLKRNIADFKGAAPTSKVPPRLQRRRHDFKFAVPTSKTSSTLAASPSVPAIHVLRIRVLCSGVSIRSESDRPTERRPVPHNGGPPEHW